MHKNLARCSRSAAGKAAVRSGSSARCAGTATAPMHCVDTWRGGDQYADLGLELRGERHSGAAVEARFDANVRLVTGVDPNCGSERDADRENELGETPGTERVRVGEPDTEGDAVLQPGS